MKKIVYTLMATLSGLVLVLSYRTSLDAVAPAVAEPAASGISAGADAAEGSDAAAGGDAEPSTTASPTPAAAAPTGSTASDGALADGTYTGSSASTRFGPVQVQITVSAGRIIDAQAVDYPDGNGRDQQINRVAVPRLVSETTQAQSADIDMVSGATYTSRGYIASLQSAIDQARAQ